MATDLDPLDDLQHLPASDVKKRGWRGVTRALRDRGAVVVTNHGEPEAVIMPPTQYRRLRDALKQERAREASGLDALRARFDERLAALRAPDAGARLRSVMRAPARLRGTVKASVKY